MKFILHIVFLLPVLSLAREPVKELPLPDFQQLAASDFNLRREAQLSMIPWIANDPEGARQTLIEAYCHSSDPELRIRLFHLLERAYFPPTRGHIGIYMGGRVTRHDGVLVTGIVPGTQAEHYGLQIGDRIMRIGVWEAKASPNVDLSAQLKSQITSYHPGSVVDLAILRGGGILEIKFRLGVFPTPSEQIRNMKIMPRGELASQLKEFSQWFEYETQKYQESS